MDPSEINKLIENTQDKKQNKSTFFGKYSSSEHSSSSFSPLSAPSFILHVDEKKAKEALARLRHVANPEEEKLKARNRVLENDPKQQAHMTKFMGEIRKDRDEDEADDEVDDRGGAFRAGGGGGGGYGGGVYGGGGGGFGGGGLDPLASATDRKDEKRLAKLDQMRPQWLRCLLILLFHVLVLTNFFTSWMDSADLLLEDAKFNLWLLEDDFNCLDIVPDLDVLDHSINILHALLSCSVLYVQRRNSATLCLAWICSQAAHTIFKTFQYFYNQKFEVESFSKLEGIPTLLGIIAFNSLGSLLLLHKYYDLTDRFQMRANKLGSTNAAERSLNDAIIYKNETHFLQRKTIIREVQIAQTYAIIKKITKHAKQGLHIDPLTVYREINAAKEALHDCADADNNNMARKLRKAYEARLKDLENQQQEVIGMGTDLEPDSHPPIAPLSADIFK